jgi:hypothetical protein
MKMEAGRVSGLLVSIYQTISGPVTGDGNLHIHSREQRVFDVTFT